MGLALQADPVYRSWLADVVDRFAADLAAADPTAPVPTCPGWDVTQLTGHLVGIHEWVGRVLTTASPASEEDATPPPGGAEALAAWYRERAEAMRRLMAAADPTASCWNFSGVNTTYGFWPRRQAHEVTVHAFDLVSAAGREATIEPGVAADGIDELLTVFGARMAARGFPAELRAPIVIAPGDVDSAWTVGPPPSPHAPVTVEGGADPAAVAALSSSASDVLLVLWKRLPVDRLVIDGDRDVALGYLASRLAP